MRKYLVVLSTLGLLLSAVGVAGAQPVAAPKRAVDVVTVTVTGQGMSKDEALKDAVRKAVERGAGTMVYSESEAKDFALMRDTVITRAQGFVEKKDILSAREVDDGVWEVQIKAVVSVKGIRDVWGTVKTLTAQLGRPKIMVFLTERIQPLVSPNPGQPQKDSTVQTRIENMLLKSGFDLVNKNQITAIQQKDLADAVATNNPAKAQAIAKSFGAQIFITGSTNAVNSGSGLAHGVLLHNFGADGDVKCFRSDTGKLMSSQNGVGESSDLNPRRSAKKSLWQLGNILGPKVQGDILRFWLDVMQGGGEIQLKVSDVSFRDRSQLKKAIEGIKGVTQVNAAKYHNRIAEFAIEAKMTAEQLAEKLSELVKNLDIEDVSQNVIKGKITKD